MFFYPLDAAISGAQAPRRTDVRVRYSCPPMASSTTRSSFTEEEQSELWEALARAQQRWLAAASVTGRDVDLAMARVLTVLCMHREHSWPDAVDALSEWARAHLPPERVLFSPLARGAAMRRALGIIADVLRDSAQHSPLARFVRAKLAPEGTDDPVGALDRRYRNPVRAQAVVEPLGGVAADSLWSEHLPWTVRLHGRVLVPASLSEAKVETARQVDALLGERDRGGRRVPPADPGAALAAIRDTLREATARAPAELMGDIAALALKVKRASIERQHTEDGRARGVLAAVLRAWGVPDADVEGMLRPFTAPGALSDATGGERLRSLEALPLVDNHPAARALYAAWGRWSCVGPSTGDEILLRVRAVLDVLVDTWTTVRRKQSVAELLQGGERALDLLGERVTCHFLLNPTAKARLLAADVAATLESVYRQAAEADLFNTPQKLGARVEGWALPVQAALQNGVKELFPWWALRASRAAAMTTLDRRLRQDLGELRQRYQTQLPANAMLRKKELAQRDRHVHGLAAASSTRVVRATARAAGLSENECRNLFPSERRSPGRRA